MKGKRISKITVLLTALILVFGISAQSTVAYLVAESDEITNTFKPIKTPVHDINVKVAGEKKIDGRDWNEKDAYTFILQLKADDPNTKDVEWSSIGNVSVDMSNKTFDLTDQVKEAVTAAGEYHFRVMEKQETVENMTFDDAVYEFKIVASADGEGNLSVSSVVRAEADLEKAATDFSIVVAEDGVYNIPVEFTNAYTDPGAPDEIDVPITVFKYMEYIDADKGDKIGPENFTFVMTPNTTGGQAVTAVTNAAGKAEFKLTFGEGDVGKTYSYVLAEKNDGRDGVTYDSTEYKIALTITKNGDNELDAEVKCSGEIQSEYKFTNTYDCYVEPTPGPTDPSDTDKPSGPGKDDAEDTGDDQNIFLSAALMAVSGIMIAVLLIDRRRRNS